MIVVRLVPDLAFAAFSSNRTMLSASTVMAFDSVARLRLMTLRIAAPIVHAKLLSLSFPAAHGTRVVAHRGAVLVTTRSSAPPPRRVRSHTALSCAVYRSPTPHLTS